MTLPSRPSISVIIPHYNRPRQLMAALKSVSAEMDLVHEVIVVDDGSSNRPVLPDLTSLAGRLVLVEHASNRGAAAARNTGVRRATGTLIAFLDCDDVWIPGKLRAQLAVLESNPDPLIAVACGWQDHGGRRAGTCRVPRASGGLADFAGGCWFCPGSTLLLPRVAFDQVGQFDESLARLEDYEWFLRFSLAGGRLLVAPVVGAVVVESRFANPAVVEAAIKQITDAYAGHRDFHVGSPAHFAKEAWFALVLATAHHQAGRPAKALLELVRSLWAKPRSTLQLGRWWTFLPPRLDKDEARRLVGGDA